MSRPITNRAVIYCRVSSTKQTKQGDGLRSQETRCREYAHYRNYEVVEVFHDDFSGGYTERPAMRAMLTYLKKHRAQGCIVIIDNIDRFARDVRGHWDLRDLLSEAGGKLESPSIEFGEDADSILHENLMASVSQHQRQKNAEQTKNRMRARAMSGYHVAKAPLGYRMERRPDHGKFLVRNEPFASIIAEAFEGYASGRFETIVEVKRYFEAQPSWPKDKKGEVHQERINELFARPIYAGHISHEQWGLHLVPAKHEPLVSLQTWLAVQNRRSDMAKAPVRKDFREDFPLRGFVTCGECGEPLTACWSKGRSASYPYYLCDTRSCSMKRKSIRKEVIEGEFETLLDELRPSEGLFNLAFHMFRDLWDAKAKGALDQSELLRNQIVATGRKIDQLLERIVDATSDTVVSAYERKIKELETEKAMLVDNIARAAKPIRSFNETYRTAFDFLGNPSKLWHSPYIEDRRAVLKLVFAERLPYVRGQGYRTAKISTPFKMLGDMDMSKMSSEKMVPPVGIEPTLLSEPDFESGASTNSTTGARGKRVAFRGAACKPRSFRPRAQGARGRRRGRRRPWRRRGCGSRCRSAPPQRRRWPRRGLRQ
jgi:site-specific DNA recombinase